MRFLTILTVNLKLALTWLNGNLPKSMDQILIEWHWMAHYQSECMDQAEVFTLGTTSNNQWLD